MVAVDPQRRTQLSRTGAQIDLGPRLRPIGPHAGHPVEWLQRPHQDSPRFVFGSAHDVGTPVHAIDPIDVEMPGWAEHHLVPWCSPPGGMAGRVLAAFVGFDLHDPAGPTTDPQGCAKQPRRRLDGPPRQPRQPVATASHAQPVGAPDGPVGLPGAFADATRLRSTSIVAANCSSCDATGSRPAPPGL